MSKGCIDPSAERRIVLSMRVPKAMKLSKLAHLISIIVGVIGALALLGAWIAGEKGTFLRVGQGHLFNDAIVLELIAIAMAVCTLVRMQLEKDRPGSSPIL